MDRNDQEYINWLEIICLEHLIDSEPFTIDDMAIKLHSKGIATESEFMERLMERYYY